MGEEHAAANDGLGVLANNLGHARAHAVDLARVRAGVRLEPRCEGLARLVASLESAQAVEVDAARLGDLTRRPGTAGQLGERVGGVRRGAGREAVVGLPRLGDAFIFSFIF